MEKKLYIKAEINIININFEDVLSTSGFSGVEDLFPGVFGE